MSLPERDKFVDDVTMWLFGLGFRSGIEDDMASKIADFIYVNEPFTLPRELSDEQKADARAIFEGKNKDRSACHFCAGLHYQVAELFPAQQPCPRIKKLKRHTDGITVVGVEYWPNGEWEDNVVFPSEVYDEGE